MNSRTIAWGLVTALLVALGGGFVFSYWSAHGTAPVPHPGYRRWRVVYYEGGPWDDYPLHLRGLVHGWMDLGWIEPDTLPEPTAPNDTHSLWQWLCTEARSEYLAFTQGNYYSVDWVDSRRQAIRAKLIDRLNRPGEIDLVLAMGTWAGKDLATDDHSVPTLVMSTSDPVASGIIASPDDSGLDHVHCYCDPNRHVRQIRAFHNIVKFKRLGVAYEDTPDGRVYANVDDLERIGRQVGFEVVHASWPKPSGPELDDRLKQLALDGFSKLGPRVDAVWIGSLTEASPRFMPGVLEPLFEHNVPTWSQMGARAVRRGVMLGMAERDLDELGLFYARTAAAIFHGARPRDLEQVHEDPKLLVVNQAAARRIGYTLPPGLVTVADAVYVDIDDSPVEDAP
ncbi:MAG: ABC transporter substrate-binding protein [Planctomycetota bacterium]